MIPKSLPPSTPIRVLCVDDQEDITTVVRMLITEESNMQCVGCLASVEHLVEDVRALPAPPDVVILDATMPGRSPMMALEELAGACPKTRTLIYSAHNDPAFIRHAKLAGAWGWVCKDDEPTSLLRAVREVADGRPVWPVGPKRTS